MNIVTPHQSKALNIGKSISLTANAGSGKTFVLAQRYLHIILNTSTPLSKVAAITFTEKAAGELYKRISIELDKLLSVTSAVKEKEKIETIRKQLVSAKISTIHSFCIDLLREFPVEASIDANFNTINERKAVELIDLSVESSLKELLKDSQSKNDIKKLIRLLGSKFRLAAELSGLISRRKNVLSLIENYYSSGENNIIKFLTRVFEKHAKLLFENDLPGILNHLNIINDLVLLHTTKNESTAEIQNELAKIKSDDNLITALIKLKQLSTKIFTKSGSVRTQGYLPANHKSDAEDSIKLVEEFLMQLNKLELSENQERTEKELAKYILALTNVFKYVLSMYENRKSESGVLDFEDILLKTKMLLYNNNVKKLLSAKYNYLLVDEFQDTNEIQYEIFLPLVDDLKNGNLFIVGDEKQSIYRFRDAELNVFSKTKADISLIEGQESLLTLPDSFRMSPTICLFVNSLFKNLFNEPRQYFNEVSSSDLVCARSDNFEGAVEFLIANKEKEDEAELVAKKIILLKEEHHDRISNWNDIAILVRKRSSFAEMQKALIKYGIPFNLVGGTGFYQKQSISDVYNYFSFLLNDRNDAALIGVLRSPFFLISDVKIFELSFFDGESYWEKLKTAASVQKEFWLSIFKKIYDNKEFAQRISVPFLLRKILRESDFITVISSRINYSQEISNLNKLISITNNFFEDQFNTLYDYVTFLQNSISGVEDEAQGRIEPGSIGVNILTIHQAKGLEYPAVFLFKCNDTTQINRVKSKSFTVDKDFGLLTNVPMDENYFGEYYSAPIVGIYNFIEEKKEIAELKRLLYVALTRAKDFLFISLSEDEKISKKNSFSGLVEEGLSLDFSKDKLLLEGELTFLRKNQNKYVNDLNAIEIEIPITRNVNIESTTINSEEVELSNKKLFLSEVSDQSKGEVISATRFSTFSACPLKYNLLYNYKITDLIQREKIFTKSFSVKGSEEYNRNELESYLFDDQQSIAEYSQLKGKIIHYALKKEINKQELLAFVEERLKKSFVGEIPKNLKEDIITDLNNFYNSEEFKHLNSFKKYYNEFEVYLKENDFYLFGILDKIIIDNKKIIIVDYKTDNIDEYQLDKRTEKYLPQLKFYAYIVSHLFAKSHEIEARIIFIKFPEKPFVFNFDDEVRNFINSGITAMVDAIRNNNYSLNLKSCNDCIFAVENSRCITII